MGAVHETLILGGGPAGAMAALVLARAGHPVVLLEREATSRHKVCGEFLSAEALELLAGVGLRVAEGDGAAIGAVRLASGAMEAEARLPFRARSLMRCVLDAALLRAAEEAGATVLRGHTVERLHQGPAGWEGTVQGGAVFRGRRVVLASGKHDLRGLARPAGVQSDLVAMKMYFRLRPEEQAALAGHVELLLHPGGYTGLQPAGEGVANLTVLVRRPRMARAGGWPGVLAQVRAGSRLAGRRLDGAEALLPKPLALSGMPYGWVRREAVGAGLYAVGDQAAVIPSFTGDGMSMALFSGRMAAEAILAGEPAAVYQREFGRRVRWQVMRATALSRLMVWGPAQRMMTAAAWAWPGGMQAAARLTRLPEVERMAAASGALDGI